MGASSLLEKYGDLEKIIKKDKFKITNKIYSIVEGGNNLTMAKSTALTLLEIVDVFEKIKPDLVFVVADRFENLSVAVAASYMNIPLAHLGGEGHSSIDEKVRHAITNYLTFILFLQKDQKILLSRWAKIKIVFTILDVHLLDITLCKLKKLSLQN